MSLFDELKRRNVFKVTAAYLALAWVITQITGTVAPAMHLPDWTVSLVLWIGAIGLPFVILFSWLYELTPEGLKRESEVDRSASITHITSRRLDYIIIALMVGAIALFAFHEFRPSRDEQAPQPEVAANAVLPAASAPAAAASTAAAVPTSDKSIAVLPFADMSAEKNQEYMSDGIAEELLNLLAQVTELRVIGRTSSFSYKGKDTKLADVARELGVANILEGSVRTSGNRVRITAQLVRASDSSHLWSATYDRTLDDIFAVQDEIAAAVVTQLKITLLGAAPQTAKVDPKAYALFLEGRQLSRQFTADSIDRSIALLQQALTIEPAYAAAWAGLASNYRTQANLGLRVIGEGIPLARDAAAKALAIDPDLAIAHSELGRIAIDYDGDLASAAQHLERALALAPSDLDILLEASTLASSLGRLDQAIMLDRFAVAHDPINVRGHAALGYDCFYTGRRDEAIESFRTALSLSPGRIGVSYYLGLALLLKGDAAASLAAIQQEPEGGWRLFGLAIANHTLGKTAESDAALAELLAKYEQGASYNIAYVLAWRNEPDRAFEYLEKAVAYRDAGLSEIVVQPLFASIRNDPRWLPLLRKIGKAPEQLAAIKFEVKLPSAG